MAKILIVDDALFMRKMLADILIKAGHQIVGEADDALKAINLYQQFQPEIITMDIIMPEVEGVNSLSAIHAIKKMNNKAIIIIVSALNEKELCNEYLNAGASDFIVKPFEAELIVNVISNQLEKSE